MTADVRTRFDRYGKGNIIVKRIALTHDQVQEHKLTPNPTKRLEADPSKYADPRAAFYVSKYGDKCWELDSLPPNILQEIVAKAIKEHIDQDAWEKSEKEEEANQKALKRMFNRTEFKTKRKRKKK